MKKILSFILTGVSLFSFSVSAHDSTPLDHNACKYELYGTTTNGKNGLSDLLGLDPATGDYIKIATIFGSGAHRVSAIEFDQEGMLYAIGEDSSDTNMLMILNCRSGLAHMVGPTGIASNQTINDISFDANGTLWAHVHNQDKTAVTDHVGTIDVDSGAFTLVGDTGIRDIGNGMSFNQGGTLIHAGSVDVSSVDTTLGTSTAIAALTFKTPADSNPRINGLDVRPVNGVMYASLNDKAKGSTSSPENYLVRLDTASGDIEYLSIPIERTVDGLAGLAFNTHFHGCLP